ncbi:hypothetical protein TRFO_09636 [Tritrichomonas foetus]|uniref:TLD family protein n=1 Tax=Tritrichomonas foetus TaxID=1144522 RepID=A0A1J4JIQ5_9EUKA|nr:hypothetical protein TRFO_09636 [Tritrichomonas foetus]|eukprot:OHS97084.1 hypothetical protein TRFO_09636 [Tritrichomonas foetus]
MVYQQIIRQWDLMSENMFGLFEEARLSFGPEWEKLDNERTKAFKQFPHFDFKISGSIKQHARDGIPHRQRRRWWLIASGGLKLLTQVGDVWKSAKKASNQVKFTSNSNFGGAVDILTFLPPAISRKLHQFLHVLYTQNRGVDFSPLIPTVSALLLLYMEVPLAYLTIQSMINKSRQDSWYFTLTREQFLASAQAFGELCEKRCQSIMRHAESLNLSMAQIGLSLFPVFFLPFMPLPVALTLFDSFMIEGRKVLFRFCLNLLIQEKKNLLNSTSAQGFLTVIINAMERLHDITALKSFLKNSFKIFLSRSRHINQVEAHAIASRSGILNIIPESSFTAPQSPSRRMSVGSPQSLNRAFSPISPFDSTQHDSHFDPHFDSQFDSSMNGTLNGGFDSSILDAPQTFGYESMIPLNRSFSGELVSSAIESSPFPGSFPARPTRPLNADLFHLSSTSNNDSLALMQQHIINRVLPEIVGGRLLTDALYYTLRQHLPTVLTRYSLNLVYATSINGNSFNELFNACKDETPYILVIQTARGVFGALLSDPPRPDKSPGDGKFYGKPVCFVFNGQTQEVYMKPHPPNQLFMCADDHALIVGGPEPAIALRQGMKTMESHACETYGSPAFAEEPGGDQVIEVELYTLVTISISAPPTGGV